MRIIPNQNMRKALQILLPLFLIPFAVWLGAMFGDAKKSLLVSLLVAALALLLFIAGIEKKKIGTRRMVIVAVMIALSVVGRFIPLFKPITALTVLAAIYLGKEAGFLVGSLSALLSNFYFGQGPWTPFQMLAWGWIGFFAGVLSRPLQKHRVLLLLFGTLAGVFFSAVMDVWSVLWYTDGLSLSLYASSAVAALPHTLLYAVSNFVFLFFLAKPFGNKLKRIQIKYGV